MATKKRGSIRIGQAFGIDVFLHITFLLLLAFLGTLPLLRGEGIGAAIEFTFLMVALFTCVLLHEFGHALMARRFGIKTRDITLLPFGGISSLERLPDRPRDEILVAVAGPAVNVVIAGVLIAIVGMRAFMLEPDVSRVGGESLLVQLFWMNVTLGVFNLLPAFPMDGGRVLRALLAMRIGAQRATRIAATVGQVVAVLFAILGVLFNPMLLLIAAFVFLAAGAESRAQELRGVLDHVPVRRAMTVRFQTLEAGDPLSRAVAVLLSGCQQDFPVMFGDRVVGLLTRADLIQALSEQRQDVSLWMVMRRDVPLITPAATQGDAVNTLQRGSYPGLPVVEEEQLVGFITLENIREYAMVQQAAAQHAESAGEPVGVM
jgi:Zn-dependent protease